MAYHVTTSVRNPRLEDETKIIQELRAEASFRVFNALDEMETMLEFHMLGARKEWKAEAVRQQKIARALHGVAYGMLEARIERTRKGLKS